MPIHVNGNFRQIVPIKIYDDYKPNFYAKYGGTSPLVEVDLMEWAQLRSDDSRNTPLGLKREIDSLLDARRILQSIEAGQSQPY